MSNLFSGINARLRGTSSKQSLGKNAPSSVSEDGRLNSPSLSHRSKSSSNLSARATPAPSSPVTSAPAPAPALPPAQAVSSAATGDDVLNSYRLPTPYPMWLNPAYAKHIVKGNFMTLSSRPKSVEQGEWMAHQVVEHYRNLWNFVHVISAKETNGINICNATTCPRMSAGPNHSYTWLNKSGNRYERTELPAIEYIAMMQRWISSKVDDTKVFPSDPAGVSFSHNPSIAGTALLSGPDEWVGKRSGFPKEFAGICETVFLQMFRVYAHLYWEHFVDPFYHLHLEKQLNSCFSHFVLTATALDLIKPKELEPLQPLIDLWAASGTFPPESKAYEYANLKAGRRLLEMAGMA